MKKQFVKFCLLGLTLWSLVSCGDMYNTIFKKQNVKVYSINDAINARLASSCFPLGDSLNTKSSETSGCQEINHNAIHTAFTNPNAHPIPVEEHLMVIFVAPAQQAVRIRLLNLQGRVLIQHHLIAAGGKEKFKLSLNNQKNGHYMVEVLAKTEHQKVKIVTQALTLKRWMIINTELVVA